MFYSVSLLVSPRMIVRLRASVSESLLVSPMQTQLSYSPLSRSVHTLNNNSLLIESTHTQNNLLATISILLSFFATGSDEVYGDVASGLYLPDLPHQETGSTSR